MTELSEAQFVALVAMVRAIADTPFSCETEIHDAYRMLVTVPKTTNEPC